MYSGVFFFWNQTTAQKQNEQAKQTVSKQSREIQQILQNPELNEALNEYAARQTAESVAATRQSFANQITNTERSSTYNNAYAQNTVDYQSQAQQNRMQQPLPMAVGANNLGSMVFNNSAYHLSGSVNAASAMNIGVSGGQVVETGASGSVMGRNADSGTGQARSAANVPAVKQKFNSETGTLDADYLEQQFTNGTGNSIVYSGWEQFNQIHSRTATQHKRKNKPKYSPDIKRWLDNGGKIEVKEMDGTQVWKYVDSNGDYAYYYNDGDISKIVFPNKYVYSRVPTVNIGEFNSDRKLDRKLTENALQWNYFLKGIPKGYVPHHTYTNGMMQLVKKKIHRKFTHIGGHSVFKDRRE